MLIRFIKQHGHYAVGDNLETNSVNGDALIAIGMAVYITQIPFELTKRPPVEVLEKKLEPTTKKAKKKAQSKRAGSE